MEEGLKRNPLKLVTRLGVQSWAIYFRLMEGFCNLESWESIFITNGIKFRQSDKYALLHDDEFSEDCVSDFDGTSSVCLKHKKRRKRRKKRKLSRDPDDSYEHNLTDVNLSKNRLDLQSRAGDWLLSTDGFSATWSSVDLPEHLSKHCFITWLKRAFSKRRDAS